jgi:hypothetical protein
MMQAQWGAAFPPLHDPARLARWLVTVHTGSMFAYPCGGEHGGSSFSMLLFVLGATLLWRARRRLMLLIFLGPFGLAIAAAAMKRYPYGGVADGSPARVMQYLVPSICLLAGMGSGALLAVFRRPRLQAIAVSACLVVLVFIGIAPLAAESFHPFRSIHAQRARQFARRFWPMVNQRAEPVCLRWDLPLAQWESPNLNVAVYLCNQMIYSPLRRQGRKPEWRNITSERPLRCVLSLADPTEPQIARWLEGMKRSYRLRECQTLVVNTAEAGAKSRTEEYTVYDFVPGTGDSALHRDTSSITSASAARSIGFTR